MRIYQVWLLIFLSPTALAVSSATVKQDGPLFAEPSPSAATLLSLKAKEPLHVLTRQGGWYQVTPAEKTMGWVRLFSVQFVKGRYQPDNIPLEELAGLVQGSHQQVTSSTGVRGLDKVAITNATPNFDNLLLLQAYQQPAAQAEAFAQSGQLQADTSISLQGGKP